MMKQKRSVYAIIRSIVRNENITEDLMQDTYVRAIEKNKNLQEKWQVSSVAKQYCP